jgi:hydroxyacylglutathione hydrolase
MEIYPGIHWLRGVVGCNCWLVMETGYAFVIDTGSPGNAHHILRYAEKHGVGDKVKYIVLTHGDLDHAGSARELKKLTGAVIALHAAELPLLAQKGNLPGPLRFVSKIFSNVGRCARVKPDMLLKEGDRIGCYQVVHTPGHTPGSLCLWEPRKIIFTGDALRTHANDRMLTPSKPTVLNMPQAMDSMRKIAELDFYALFGGHGPPVIGDAADKLRKLLSTIPAES